MPLTELFGGKIKPDCRYCEYAYPTGGDSLWICSKKGTICNARVCAGYRYDPIMRVPHRPLELEKFEEADFSLSK